MMELALPRRRGAAFAAVATALLLASCAGGPPPVNQASPSSGAPLSGGPQYAAIQGVNLAYPEFQTSAFPYRGDIPEKNKPFLDVAQGGRLGHSSRGGVYWEDQTYNDRHVLVAAPEGFDARSPGALIVFFHGNQATLARDVVDRQQAPRQLAQSGLNGVLVAPQMAVDALDSSAGRFWEPGALASFLDEADTRLATLMPGVSHSAFRRMPVIIVAYSGGYLPAAFALAQGGASERVRGVVLLDALYGEEDKFADWIARAHGRAFFVSAYSKSSHDENEALRARLNAAGIETMDHLPDHLDAGTVAFIDAGDVAHVDFVSYAWTSDPLRDILARVAR